jgi:hypothetical protein
MRNAKSFLKRQVGYLLLEAAIAMSLAAGLVTYYMRQQSYDLLEDMAKAHGEQMQRIANATNRYVVDNYTAILNNTPVTGVAVTRRPTVAELSGLGFLPAGYGANPPVFGGGYQIELQRVPAACVPGINCRINGLLMTTAPVLGNGQFSSQLIGKALQTIGADGGATGLGGTPVNTVTGLNNSWTQPVLGGITPAAGLMAVQVGWNDELLNNRFLLRDGTLPMTGNLDAGNNSINNAANVNANQNMVAGNNINAGTDMAAGRNIWASNGISAGNDIGAGRNISASNGISAGNDIGAGRDISATRNLGVGSSAYISGDVHVGGKIYGPNQTFAHGDSYISGDRHWHWCPDGYFVTGYDCTGHCGTRDMIVRCSRIVMR